MYDAIIFAYPLRPRFLIILRIFRESVYVFCSSSAVYLPIYLLRSQRNRPPTSVHAPQNTRHRNLRRVPVEDSLIRLNNFDLDLTTTWSAKINNLVNYSPFFLSIDSDNRFKLVTLVHTHPPHSPPLPLPFYSALL